MNSKWQFTSQDPFLAMDDFNSELLSFQHWDDVQSQDGLSFKSTSPKQVLPEYFNECCDSILPEETSLFEDEDFNLPKLQQLKKSGFSRKPQENAESLNNNISSTNLKLGSKSITVSKSSNKKRASPSKNKKKQSENLSSVNYSQMVDSIFGESDKPQGFTELSERRDVVNKRILRGFKKFIADLFIEHRVRPCRLKNKDTSFKQGLIVQAKSIGLIPQEKNYDTEHFRELVCWMAMSKNTCKAKALFDYSNQSIVKFEDLLSRYSHKKLEMIYQDSNIAQIYEYFMHNGMECFIQKCPEDKRKVYSEWLIEIQNQFNNIC